MMGPMRSTFRRHGRALAGALTLFLGACGGAPQRLADAEPVTGPGARMRVSNLQATPSSFTVSVQVENVTLEPLRLDTSRLRCWRGATEGTASDLYSVTRAAHAVGAGGRRQLRVSCEGLAGDEDAEFRLDVEYELPGARRARLRWSSRVTGDIAGAPPREAPEPPSDRFLQRPLGLVAEAGAFIPGGDYAVHAGWTPPALNGWYSLRAGLGWAPGGLQGAVMNRLRLVSYREWLRLGLGAGTSGGSYRWDSRFAPEDPSEFASSPYANTCCRVTADFVWWADAEAFLQYLSPGGVLFEARVGWTHALNPGALACERIVAPTGRATEYETASCDPVDDTFANSMPYVGLSLGYAWSP